MKPHAASLRILVFGTLWWTVALAPAPIVNRGDQLKAVPEQSQETLSMQQQFSGSQPVIGFIPEDPEQVRSDSLASDPDATESVIAGSAQVDDPAANEVGARAGKAGTRGEGWPAWLMGVLVLGLAFGTLMALRVWADRKLVPTPAKPVSKKQDLRW